MLRVRVLRLVHEDVVDAAVELVEEPAGVAPLQEVEGLGDQVVEVEGALARLQGFDPAADVGPEHEERARALQRSGRAQALGEGREPGRLGVERLPQVGGDRLRAGRSSGAARPW